MRTIALVMAICATPAFAADDEWKLQPLKYNNSQLTVDLGVGLWAWPLPMDYDQDGDMDLLVSCPDKPSNGVYFFENPTQDRQRKMPVFKAGVRLGPTGHNMQVSYVNGRARILRPQYEYLDFRSGLDAQTTKTPFSGGSGALIESPHAADTVSGNCWT